jgi:hypothetical protein
LREIFNMAFLSDFTGVPPYEVDALPLIGMWGNYANYAHIGVYDSNLQPVYVSFAGVPGEGTYNEVTYIYADYSSELGNTGGVHQTQNTIGTNGVTTSWVNATPWHQADGHWGLRFGGFDTGGGEIAKNYEQIANKYPYFGVVVGKRGVRQKISLYLLNNVMRIHRRGQWGYDETVTISSSTFSTWNNQTSYGMIGYNDRTRTLVAIESTAANVCRMHIWKNLGEDRSLNEDNYQVGTLDAFLREAKAGGPSGTQASYNYYDFTWASTNAGSYNESRYRMRVIPGDNGIIGLVRMVPSNRVEYATFDPSTSTLNTSYNSLTLTTSYGIDQSTHYGMRHEITWNNEWVAAYAPYYYYGCGMMNYFVNTKDPTKTYTASDTNTTSGCRLLPIGEDKFIWNNSATNANESVGMTAYIVDIGGIYRNGFRANGSAVSNNGAISFTDSGRSDYQFDIRYTSTNYPCLVPVERWIEYGNKR